MDKSSVFDMRVIGVLKVVDKSVLQASGMRDFCPRLEHESYLTT